MQRMPRCSPSSERTTATWKPIGAVELPLLAVPGCRIELPVLPQMPVANGRPAHISAGRRSAFGPPAEGLACTSGIGPGVDVAYGSYVVARILGFPRFLVGFGSGSIASPS